MHNDNVLGGELELFFSRPITEELTMRADNAKHYKCLPRPFSSLCSNVLRSAGGFTCLQAIVNWNDRHLGPDKLPEGEGITPTHLDFLYVKTGTCINSSDSSQVQRWYTIAALRRTIVADCSIVFYGADAFANRTLARRKHGEGTPARNPQPLDSSSPDSPSAWPDAVRERLMATRLACA